MKNSFIDTGMKSVVMTHNPDSLIPVINISGEDESKDVYDTGWAPNGAGFGTRGTTESFTGKFNDLIMLNLLLTKKCNFRCSYCVEDKDLPDENQWNYSNFESLVQWIKDQNVSHNERVTLSFFGGEPLLEWDTIKEFMRHGLDKYGDIIKFNISTNIVLLDDKKLKWLDDNTVNDDITFLLSLDGFERVKSRHAAGNPDNNLMHIIRANIENMRNNYSRLFKKSSFRVSLLPEYLDIIEEDLMEMVDYGPENIIVHPVTTEPNAPWTTGGYKYLTDIINRVCEYAIETSNVEVECMEGVSKKTHNCGAGHSMLAVNPDGGIYSCYFTAHAEMDGDILGNYLSGDVMSNRANIYKLNPNYDPECGSCDKKYCFQCSVKNLLHHGEHFCSSMWCKELADLYEDTLEMCNLTKINRQISSNAGMTLSDTNAELSCLSNDIVGLVNAVLSDSPYEPDSCGCHDSEGSRLETLLLLRDLSTVKLALEAIHNQKYPDNTVTSL